MVNASNFHVDIKKFGGDIADIVHSQRFSSIMTNDDRPDSKGIEIFRHAYHLRWLCCFIFLCFSHYSITWVFHHTWESITVMNLCLRYAKSDYLVQHLLLLVDGHRQLNLINDSSSCKSALCGAAPVRYLVLDGMPLHAVSTDFHGYICWPHLLQISPQSHWQVSIIQLEQSKPSGRYARHLSLS